MESMSSIISIVTDALEEHDLKPSSIGTTVDEKARPVLVLDGLTYDPETGEVKVAKREYEWSGTVTITLSVDGRVEAQDEEEAEEKASNIMEYVEVDSIEVSSGDDEFEANTWSIDVDGEVDTVREV